MPDVNYSAAEEAQRRREARVARQLMEAYDLAVDAIVSSLVLIPGQIDNKLFRFTDYPQIREQVNTIFRTLHSMQLMSIRNGIEESWNGAGSINDKLIDQVYGRNKKRLPKRLLKTYQDRNLSAMNSFITRKTGGMGLSAKVWKYTRQARKEIELGIDLGLGEGKPAAKIARDVKGYLRDPEKLFRRVRDKHGNLVLSKTAKAYHPGQGVYRSSVKNAQRMARTGVNMAYRQADQEQWGNMDFVVGYEIRLSRNPNTCPVCEALAGKYPKDFVFIGWHPQCYSDDTEVLTDDGWKLFQNLLPADKIFSLNPETKNVEFVGYKNFVKYHKKGEMVRYHNRSLDMLVTKDHKMVYLDKKSGHIRTDRISENYSMFNGGLYRSSQYDSVDIVNMVIGDHVIKFDHFSEFMAYYLSEGSLSWSRKNQLKIAQCHRNHRDQYEKISSCLSALPFKYSKMKDGFYIRDEALYNYLKQFGKSPQKHVPDIIKRSSARQIAIFLDAYAICDGYTRLRDNEFIGNRGNVFKAKNRERKFFTSSDKMAADIGELLVKIGKRPSYTLQKIKGVAQKHRNGTYYGNKDLWVIGECHSKTATVFEKSLVPYDGFVYDIELEKNHILYVRRNGKCAWGSNCRCFKIPILKTDAELERDTQRILTGDAPLAASKNTVERVPGNFKKWIEQNRERIDRAKSKPYFIRDNPGVV